MFWYYSLPTKLTNNWFTAFTHILYYFREVILFIWLLTDPLFRYTYFRYPIQLLCRRRGKLMNLTKFDKLIEIYEHSSQAFLGVSLNMEIVCSALTGINKTLKEIDFNQDKHTFLTQEDFKYKKREKLKKIKVLSPEYFA